MCLSKSSLHSNSARFSGAGDVDFLNLETNAVENVLRIQQIWKFEEVV